MKKHIIYIFLILMGIFACNTEEIEVYSSSQYATVFCRRREKIRNVFIRSGFYESCFDVWFKATLFVFILMLNPFSLKYFFSYL